MCIYIYIIVTTIIIITIIVIKEFYCRDRMFSGHARVRLLFLRVGSGLGFLVGLAQAPWLVLWSLVGSLVPGSAGPPNPHIHEVLETLQPV